MKSFAFLLAGALAAGASSLIDPSPALGAWTANGNPIAYTERVEDHPIIARDDAGGAFIAWQTNEAGDEIYYLKRITSSGDLAPGWSDAPLRIAGPASDGRLLPDGAGGVFSCWVTLLPYPSLWGLGATRVTSTGSPSPGWASGLIAVGPPRETGTESPRAYGAVTPWPVSDGSGGFLIAWSYIDRLWEYVHVTHYLGSGTVAGEPFQSSGLRPVICWDGGSGAYVSWFGGVRLQHVLSSGAADPPWPASGITLSTHIQPYGNSPVAQGLCADNAGGVFVAWLEQRGTAAFQLVMQHVTDSCTIAPG